MNLNCRLIGNADPATERSETVDLPITPLACLFILPLYAPGAWAEPAPTELPSGGQVSAGQASIAVNGSHMDVNQSSQNAAINWQTFNIGSNAQVDFHQPDSSAVAVNRIADTNGSQIMGKLNANGQVYLINPNGVLFGKGSQVNVGGLVASTLDTGNDPAGGRRAFAAAGGNGKIVNQGTLNAGACPEPCRGGGYIALLGSQVSNQGVIQAKLGTVALAAGDKITLEFSGDKLIDVEVDKGALQTLAENKQLIQADGGIILMTAKAADALLSGVVNNEGVIEARTVENHNGVIKLLGDMDSGTVNVGGTLDASAPSIPLPEEEGSQTLPSPSGRGAGGEGAANGGFIETSAAHVKIADDAKITTKAENGKNGTWLIDPVDFTIASGSGTLTASGIGATTLSTSLAGANVSITTGAGTAGNGDIFVNSAVSWSANTLLKLIAHGNIYLDANLNGSGATSQLYLAYGQQTATGNGYDYYLRNGAKVSLTAGANFTTEKGYGADNTVLGDGGGTTTNWTVVTGLGVEGDATVAPGTMTLQGMKTDLTDNYVLGADIDASGTSTWNANTGFTQVGTFTGKFDGLGHTISNLYIHRTGTDIGLFGATNNAVLQNVGLLNVDISAGSNGVTGALAGRIQGNTAIRNSYVDGGTVHSITYMVGGLVGFNGGTSAISYSYTNVSVTSAAGGGGGAAKAGGLVGFQNGGSISNSYATGSVTGNSGTPSENKEIGGLVGIQSAGSISNSYATGSVSGNNTLGGLVGSLAGGSAPSNSYWDKTTTGQANSYSGGGTTGGLLTTEWSTLGPFGSAPSNGAWSTADWGSGNPYPGVKALPYITITASASQTYGSAATFGIASILDQTDTDATGRVNTGSLTWSAGTTASSAAGTTAAVRGSGATGTGYQILYAGNLTVGKAPLTVTANGFSKTYDGLAYSGGNGVGYSGFVNSEGSGVLGGTLAYGGSSQGAVNAGTYAITPSGLTSGNYNISFAGGNLTINKAALTVTATAASKTYDGLAYSGGNGVSYSGFVNGETASVLGGTLAYGGAWQGAVNAGTYAITPSGLTSGNYNISYVGGSLTINPAALTVTALDAGKTYDGLAYSGGNGVSYSGFVNGETASVLGGTLAYGGSSQGAVNAGNYTLAPSGLTSSNYAISFADGTLAINPAALAVTALAASKTYDGLAYSGGNGVSYSGFANGETASVLGGSLVYGGASQGAVNAGTYAIMPSGLTSSNYTISFASADLTVIPATLTYTAAPASFFSGQVPAGLTGTVTGFTANDTLENSASGTLTWTTDALATSRPGRYAINGGGLSLTTNNYILAQASGNATALTLQPGRPPEAVMNTIAQLEANPQTSNQPDSNTITVTQENASGNANTPTPGTGSIAQLKSHQETISTNSTKATLKLVTPGVKLPDNRIGED
jgi:filamentous hemagglutinin family protein